MLYFNISKHTKNSYFLRHPEFISGSLK